MHKGHVKLPDDFVLRQHLANGMTPAEIAIRYSCSRETVRKLLHKKGLSKLVVRTGNAIPSRKPAPIDRARVRFLPEKTVFTREFVAGDHGGTAFRRISVPHNSMHVAELLASGRC